jgi:hypothetical protein
MPPCQVDYCINDRLHNRGAAVETVEACGKVLMEIVSVCRLPEKHSYVQNA